MLCWVVFRHIETDILFSIYLCFFFPGESQSLPHSEKSALLYLQYFNICFSTLIFCTIISIAQVPPNIIYFCCVGSGKLVKVRQDFTGLISAIMLLISTEGDQIKHETE